MTPPPGARSRIDTAQSSLVVLVALAALGGACGSARTPPASRERPSGPARAEPSAVDVAPWRRDTPWLVRSEAGARDVIDGSLRAHVVGDAVTLSDDDFGEEIADAFPVERGWVFVSRDGV